MVPEYVDKRFSWFADWPQGPQRTILLTEDLSTTLYNASYGHGWRLFNLASAHDLFK